jgi:hypothetical protein
MLKLVQYKTKGGTKVTIGNSSYVVPRVVSAAGIMLSPSRFGGAPGTFRISILRLIWSTKNWADILFSNNKKRRQKSSRQV